MLFLAKYFGFDIQFLNHNQDFSDPNQRAFVDCSVRNLFSGMSLQTRSSVWFFRTRHKEVWSSKGTGASLFEEIYHIYNTKKQQTVPLTSANSVQLNQEWVFLLFYLKKKTWIHNVSHHQRISVYSFIYSCIRSCPGPTIMCFTFTLSM